MPRPVLINNWEATHFDFDSDKLIEIAERAADKGIEMFVMDDGWFGHRNSDNSSLGDWVVNKNKIKGGLKHLVNRINSMGMKFGIWFEPEMVSPDSDCTECILTGLWNTMAGKAHRCVISMCLTLPDRKQWTMCMKV